MKHCKKIILSILTCGMIMTGMITYANTNTQIPTVVTNNTKTFDQELCKLKKEGRPKSGASASSISAYSSLRLIVKAKSATIDFSQYPIRKIVKGPDNLYALLFETEKDTRDTEKKLNQLNSIVYAEPDYKIQPAAGTSVSKAHWTWGAERLGGDYFADEISRMKPTASLKVAVIDTGVYRNDCIKDRLLTGYNVLDGNTSTIDQDGHGTHVAGIIYDMTNNLNLKILPVKVLDGVTNGRGSTSDIVSAIHYAEEQGAKVINISVVAYPVNGKTQHSHYLEDAIREAVNKKDTTVVVAAGNERINVKDVCPADVKEAIVVGAVDDLNRIEMYSDYGSTLDLVAPGKDIYSTYLTRMSYDSGTSMAAPHITALAAMLKMMYPSYSPAKIEYVLKLYCKDLGPAGWDETYGQGIPDFNRLRIVTNLTLNKTSLHMKACETASLTAKIVPTNATIRTLTWTSSNQSVAKVSSNGQVIAMGPGKAILTVSTANGVKATCSVSVDAAEAMSRYAFKISEYNASTQKCTIAINGINGSTGTQVQLQDGNKKTLATKTGKKQCVFSGVKTQKLYYYRARAYYDINGTRVYGTWSYRRMFAPAVASTTRNTAKTGVYVKAPSISGITSYELCFSLTNKTGSFVKIASLLPGKSYLLTKFKNKNLRSYPKGYKFYIVLKPKYATTAPSDAKYVRHAFTVR